MLSTKTLLGCISDKSRRNGSMHAWELFSTFYDMKVCCTIVLYFFLFSILTIVSGFLEQAKSGFLELASSGFLISYIERFLSAIRFYRFAVFFILQHGNQFNNQPNVKLSDSFGVNLGGTQETPRQVSLKFSCLSSFSLL